MEQALALDGRSDQWDLRTLQKIHLWLRSQKAALSKRAAAAATR